MKLIPTWPIAAGCLLVGAAVGVGADHLWMVLKVARVEKQYSDLVLQNKEDARKREAQRGIDERAARQREMELAARVGQIEQEKTNEIDRIRTAYSVQLAGLQNRPDRKPASSGGVPSTSAPCSGSTGAELSRPDAIFLGGEAARADELRAALSACYAAYDSVSPEKVRAR